MRQANRSEPRIRRLPFRLAWVARAEDPRTSGLVRSELQVICDRHEVGAAP